MQTDWTRRSGDQEHGLSIIIKGKAKKSMELALWTSSRSDPGGAGTSVSYTAFLNGEYHSTIRSTLGNSVLEDAIRSVVMLARKEGLKLPVQYENIEFKEPIDTKGKTPLWRDDWYRGYDLEYEYTVEIYEDCIRWYLEFDEQWTDPPEEVIQSLEDYIENGAPSTFSDGGNSKQIQDKVRSIMKKYKK